MSPFDETMERFLEAGDAPVYFGWGSMSRLHNDELCRAALEACMMVGKRGVILGGGGNLSLDMLDKASDSELVTYAKENILFAPKANHILLFPRCCCVVIHGGAGTSAAAFRSGRPGIVTPAAWDQKFFADRFEALGNGLRGPHMGKLNGPELAELILKVPHAVVRERTLDGTQRPETPGSSYEQSLISGLSWIWGLGVIMVTSDPSYAEAAIKIRQEIVSREPGDLVSAQRMHARIVAKKAEKKQG
eukprot:scaffold2827_cov409-Prasinococcus_capsulatus_cf.AAC.4